QEEEEQEEEEQEEEEQEEEEQEEEEQEEEEQEEEEQEEEEPEEEEQEEEKPEEEKPEEEEQEEEEAAPCQTDVGLATEQAGSPCSGLTLILTDAIDEAAHTRQTEEEEKAEEETHAEEEAEESNDTVTEETDSLPRNVVHDFQSLFRDLLPLAARDRDHATRISGRHADRHKSDKPKKEKK
ncbi:MAG: hypothetical protein H7838_05725, partial [Magnetococcus sp. DMHC-8]